MKFTQSAIALILTVLLLVASLPIGVFATEVKADKLSYTSELYSDATLNGYKQYETMWTDNTYVKGQAKLTVYFDTKNATTKRDVIFYVINWNGERIGTDSDVSIVTDNIKAEAAVESGNRAAVIVVDYGGNPNACANVVELSLAKLRTDLVSGGKLTVWKDPSAAQKTTTTVSVHASYVYFLPAGYRIARDIPFWESNKHSSLGTLDSVMNAWNKEIAGIKMVYYAYHSGDTSTCTYDHASASGVECIAGAPQIDANGNVVAHSGQKAPTVTRAEDCRKSNGEPLNYTCRLDIIYPSGENVAETPVYTMAATQSPRTTNVGTTEGRTHLVGFTFCGYTAVVFDHAYIPMARTDHYGYINRYGTNAQNAAKVARAAIRCVRYYANEFGYSDELIGVAGLSKGTPTAGVLSTVNNKDVTEKDSYTVTVGGKTVKNTDLYFEGDVIAADGTVTKATVQPYMTYKQGYDGTYSSTDAEISSEVTVAYCAAGDGINWTYQSGNPSIQLGGKREDGTITTHVPMVLSCGLSDQYGCWDHWDGIQARFEEYATNPFLNISMEDQGHTYPFGIDPFRGYDRYAAYFNFFHRYLKPDAYAPSTAWIGTGDGLEDVSVNGELEVKFTSSMDAESVKNNATVINVTTGKAVEGEWTANDVNTLFTFTHAGLDAGCEYRINIPEGVKDDQGIAMTEAVSNTFKTEGDVAVRPIADTYVSAAEPNAVFGTEKTLVAGGKNDSAKLAFATFSAEQIRSASSMTLRLIASKAQKVLIYAIDGYQVDEDTLCYANMPSLADKAVLVGEYSLAAGENEIKMSELAGTVKYSYVTLVIAGTGKSASEVSFASHEETKATQITLVAKTAGEGEAIADTYVSSTYPNSVFGNADVLKLDSVGGAENIVFATYLQSSINKATSVHLSVPDCGVGQQKVSVYLLDGYTVDEATLCYANMPDFKTEGTLVGEYTVSAGSKIDMSDLAELVKQARFTLVFLAETVDAYFYGLDFETNAAGDILPAYNSSTSPETQNNNCYSTTYLFRKGGAVGDFVVVSDPVDSGNKAAASTANQNYNRMKFYNTLTNSEMTSADIGRKFHIVIRAMSTSDASLSCGMMNGYGTTYSSSFYTPAGSETAKLMANEWQEIVYEVTIDEEMVKNQIGMFTVQLGTKGAKYFFDDFKVVELDASGASVPLLQFASSEDGSAAHIKLEAEGVVTDIPEDDPDETDPSETNPSDTDPVDDEKPTPIANWLIPVLVGVVVIAIIGAVVAVVLNKKKK